MTDTSVEQESFLRKYFKGWMLRTAKPTFTPDDEISVFLTGVEDDTPIARVGDTIIEVPDAPQRMVDSRVKIRVTDFDAAAARGTATYIEKVGESAF